MGCGASIIGALNGNPQAGGCAGPQQCAITPAALTKRWCLGRKYAAAQPKTAGVDADHQTGQNVRLLPSETLGERQLV